MATCPRTGADLLFAGRHVLLDLHGAKKLNNLPYMRQACIDAAKATGATVIGDNFHYFGGEGGISGLVLLAESHLSVHSWPEFGMATFDIFVCGDCDPMDAVPILTQRFRATRVTTSLHHRGELPPAPEKS